MTTNNETAVNAINSIEKLASYCEDSNSTVREFCKICGFDDKFSSYAVKFARRFEEYMLLSAEDLVKAALARFMKDSNPDSVLSGIKKKASCAQDVCTVARCMAEKRAKSTADDMAIVYALASRSNRLSTPMSKVAGIFSRLFGGAAEGAIKRTAGGAAEGALKHTAEGVAEGTARNLAEGTAREASRGFGGTAGLLGLGAGAGAIGSSYLPDAYNNVRQRAGILSQDEIDKKVMMKMLPYVVQSGNRPMLMQFLRQQAQNGMYSPELWDALATMPNHRSGYGGYGKPFPWHSLR